MRPVARDKFSVDVEAAPGEIVRAMNVRFVLNYRYSGVQYKKFLIDQKINFCKYLNGDASSELIDIMLNNLWNITNMHRHELKCPLSENLYLKSQSYNMQNFFAYPILPSGQFRADFNVTNTSNPKKKTLLLLIQFFFRVSDIRLWH